MRRRGSLFAAIVLAITVVGTGLLELRYSGEFDRQAVRMSALLTFAVQMLAFQIARSGWPRHVMAAWSVGALLRMTLLVTWGIVAVKALGLPAEATLVSTASMLFASTLIEPLFLTNRTR